MMMNAGSFWSTFGVRFGAQASAIETLLQRDSFTLQQLLDEEDVIQECKYMNHQLVDYLAQPDVIEQLIRYCVELPENLEEKEERVLRYPYVASELFACEVMSMLDVVLENERILKLLFSFLDQPSPIDPGASGYFRKVMVVLIQRKYDALVQYIQKHPEIITKMVNHIGLYSIMELLIMIGWDDGSENVGDVTWLYHEGLVAKLVDQLRPEMESVEGVHVNAARALVDVVVKFPPEQPNLLVTHLQSQPIVEKLFQHMFSGSMSCLTNCLSVITVLVQRNASQIMMQEQEEQERAEFEAAAQNAAKESGNDSDDDNSNDKDKQETNQDPSGPGASDDDDNDDDKNKNTNKNNTNNNNTSSTDDGKTNGDDGENKTAAAAAAASSEATAKDPPALINLIRTHLPKFYELLGDNKSIQSPALVQQYGVLDPPLGETRMKVCELFLVLFRSNYESIFDALIEMKALDKIVDLFFEYQWNNMLHGLVENIIHTVLECKYEPVKHSLFGDARLIQRIVETSRRVRAEEQEMKANMDAVHTGKRYLRPGFMGHLIRVSEDLRSSDDPVLATYLEDEEWTVFTETTLTDELMRQQIQLGGHRPTTSYTESDDDVMQFNHMLTSHSPDLGSGSSDGDGNGGGGGGLNGSGDGGGMDDGYDTDGASSTGSLDHGEKSSIDTSLDSMIDDFAADFESGFDDVTGAWGEQSGQLASDWAQFDDFDDDDDDDDDDDSDDARGDDRNGSRDSDDSDDDDDDDDDDDVDFSEIAKSPRGPASEVSFKVNSAQPGDDGDDDDDGGDGNDDSASITAKTSSSTDDEKKSGDGDDNDEDDDDIQPQERKFLDSQYWKHDYSYLDIDDL